MSQDGRNDLYGADELRRQEGLLETADAEAIEQSGITCVLADRGRPSSAALAARADWQIMAESSQLTLLVRDRDL